MAQRHREQSLHCVASTRGVEVRDKEVGMLKKAALIWGIIFVILGIAGFIPGITTTNSMDMKELFGLFMVDGTHNVVHLLTGLVALASTGSERSARVYFQVIGIVYALITIIGFAVGSGGYVLGFLLVNTADNFLHLVIALVALYLGFGYRTEQTTRPAM